MTPSDGSNVPPAKRRKLDNAPVGEAEGTVTSSASLNRPVSPPISSRKIPVPVAVSLLAPAPTWGFDDVPQQTLTPSPSQLPPPSKQTKQSVASSSETLKQEGCNGSKVNYVASPFQLTQIRDLAPHQNIGTIELKDILGHPMIKECWNFNFLFDLDFVMQQFDEDVRDVLKVKIIHGFWKRDDERRIDLMETAERYPNIELINAYLPDPFGTHHSKMLILFRHDDYAQVIIHTANMISKDWTNMTQAVWRSPLLPLSTDIGPTVGPYDIGSGDRFQLDLLRYLGKYEKRLRTLSDQLALYDFSEIRAAFLGSTPSRQVVSTANSMLQTSFGWLGLQEILNSVPAIAQTHRTRQPHIVLQVSSIATLGAVPTWLSHFQSVLARSRTPQHLSTKAKARFNVIFPTPEEVRTSLDGYESGGSIHTKVESAQQQKQLQYLRPMLCHWKHPSSSSSTFPTEARKAAHRGPAAPHIKTYIRFSDDTHRTIDWALLTSANLSKQAWGDVVNKQGEVRIQSYEAGVLVWPELFAEPGCGVSMVPTFGRDVPGSEDVSEETLLQRGQDSEADMGAGDEDEETEDENTNEDDVETEDEDEHPQQSGQTHPATSPDAAKGKDPAQDGNKKHVVVGLRMPYDLPLRSYGAKDLPWCATQQYTEPDWKGRIWGGFQPH